MTEAAQKMQPGATGNSVGRPALNVHDNDRPSLEDAKPFKSRPVTDRKTIRAFARALDFVGLCLISVITLSGLPGGLYGVALGEALPYLAAPAIIVWGIWSADGYRFPFTEKVLDHLARTAIGSSLAIAALGLLVALTTLGGDAMYFAGFSAIGFIGVMTAHAHHVAFTKHLIRSGRLSENVVIVGATANARKLIEKNAVDRELNIVAIFDDRLGRAPMEVSGIPVVGTLDDLLAWTHLPKVDRIIVTVTSKAQARVKLLIERLRYLPNRVILLLDLEDFNADGASLAEVADAPAAYVSGAPADARRATVKRISDIVIGSCMLIGFAPIMLLVALLVKLDSPGPVFFRQKRHGFNNQVIRVWKFRTMRPDRRAEEGDIRQVTSDDDRVTKIGRILRKTSLDELPQLFNILLGEMSLVGPRPHAIGMTTEETEVHELVSDYAHRHRVKPGLTGWAQINGSRGPVHTAEEVRERVRLDMEYVNRASFWFDLYVMLMTAPCLLGDSQNDR